MKRIGLLGTVWDRLGQRDSPKGDRLCHHSGDVSFFLTLRDRIDALMNEAERQRFSELVKEDQIARSTAFVEDLNWLGVSHYILNQNFREAVQIPEALERKVELLSRDRRHEAGALHLEFVRRLHNYLAAAKTLVDHTRAFRSRWTDEACDSAFETTLEELLTNPVVKFIQELRNPTQHSRLPPVARVTTFEADSSNPNTVRPVVRLMVKARDLENLYEWSSLALAYIRANVDHENVDVTLALRRYQELLESLYAWFFQQLTITWKNLLDDFDHRRQELARLTTSASKDDA